VRGSSTMVRSRSITVVPLAPMSRNRSVAGGF
jgi:hypothetical protein